MAESGCPAPDTLPLEALDGAPPKEELWKSTSASSAHLRPKESGLEPPQDGCQGGACTPEVAARRDGARPRCCAGPLGGVENHRPCAEEGRNPAWKENHVASANNMDQRGDRLEPAKQPVQRSHSDSLHISRETPRPQVREAGFPCQWVNYCSRETPGCPSLVCKQAMQLQQNNTVTVCQCGGGSPAHPLSSVQICVPSAGELDAPRVGCGETCYGPHVHACSLGDACAAFCHHLPIPAPVPLPPRLVDGERGGQRAPHHHVDRLAFPRLVTSVSETGLDTKSVTCCCGGEHVERSAARPGEGRQTRDTGTMTTHWDLKDVGVQVGQPQSTTPPHVFPEVSLVEETEAEEAATQKSPVREVAWDAEGMTWEVYGASVDPEELGLAIQKHLELQIKETASRAARLVRQDTASSQQSGRRRKRGGGSVISSLRNPTCCVRSSAAVD
nr:G protein-regulated inducer of neurite outgrowth 2-like [Paramormyrops kingsleyae]